MGALDAMQQMQARRRTARPVEQQHAGVGKHGPQGRELRRGGPKQSELHELEMVGTAANQPEPAGGLMA